MWFCQFILFAGEMKGITDALIYKSNVSICFLKFVYGFYDSHPIFLDMPSP